MLDPATIHRIAELARIELTDAERSLLATQLTTIIDYIDQLQGVDVTALADEDAAALPSRPIPSPLVLRADTPAASLPRNLALANAPRVEAGQVWVPGFLPEDA